MLQIQNIHKQYVTGKLVQNALDDVSLNLRDNEFVAILGPSGSGKTTLLNIIGGLDRYDRGDLIINGVSTKQYKDRDWDSYRNHTIGFVFQSYNLIPHQTLLSNVELALTISGIGKSERKRRAIEALEKVGLGEQIEKRPNQLSGGQMQRVAIARALVNDPDILLADEPTGALDSDTSVQVMELLKEVAKDRLVVMVTHNPELADEYATRIVRLRDGKIRSDTDPFEPDTEQLAPPEHRNLGKASMSLATSIALSFNNLRTKKARTLLTSFAGSIGIIGIALILALSNGVNDYIKSVEEETLSEYPLQIQSTGLDLTAMMGASGLIEVDNKDSKDKKDDKKEIKVMQVLTNSLSSMDANDLESLKTYFDSGESKIEKYTNAIEYQYDVLPHIYRIDEEKDKIRQINPDRSFDAMGIGSSASGNSLMSSMMSTNVFFQMPSEEKLYKSQYDVKAGHWPKKYNECVVVLSENGAISDYLLYALGLRDSAELDKMVKQMVDGGDIDVPENLGTYTYDDILGTKYKLVNSYDYYTYDAQYKVWKDKSDDTAYMKKLVENGEDITIVGIVQPAEDANGVGLTMGINYPESLTRHVVANAKESEAVKAQMADRKTNIFTGDPFGEDREKGIESDSMFQIDTSALQNAFKMDGSLLNSGNMDPSVLADAFRMDGNAVDLSGMMNLDQVNLELPELEGFTLGDLMKSIKITAQPEDVSKLVKELSAGYKEYEKDHPGADMSNLGKDFAEYLQGDGKEVIRQALLKMLNQSDAVTIDADKLQQMVVDLMTDFQNQGYTELDQFNEYMSAKGNTFLKNWAKQNLNIDVEKIDISPEQLNSMAGDLAKGYLAYAKANGKTDPSKIGEQFVNYLGTEEASKILTDNVSKMIDTDALKKQISAMAGQYMSTAFASYGNGMGKAMETQINAAMQQIMNQIAGGMTSAMTQMMSQIGSSLENAMNIDGNAFADAFSMNMNGDELMELFMSMGAAENATYEGNLKSLGYIDFAKPSSINIYPKDFESKEKVVGILDGYNDRMEKAGEEDKVITYTDMVGALMSSVTNIIDVISYVLIAFVAISLVVSSIMIGVITYISVLERKKEIGILRAIGASKNNISQVFNAETGIIGLCAGLLGILLTLLILIPGNALIHHIADNNNINASVPPLAAIILILLSMVLTLIGGLIPSRKAAKSDPVTALRTD